MRNHQRIFSLLTAGAFSSLLFACAASPKAAMAPTTYNGGAMPGAPAPTMADNASPEVESAPSQAPQRAPVTSQAFAGNAAPTQPAAPAGTVAKTTPDAKPAQTQQEVSNPDVFILYTGGLSLLVDDGKIAPVTDKIIDAAIAVGGHIGSRKDTSVSIIVPSKSFRAVFAQIENLGEVTHRSISAEDVSEEYHDAEVRLSNMKATRKRLEEFLSKAPSINDMLTVERELERVVMDIDRTEGRMRFLREHTAFSTLTVDLAAKPKVVPLVVTPPAPPPEAPPAPPRAIDLPASWLGEMGVNRLINGK
jgi:Domain of unknown function (DUF4349)